MCIQIVLPGEPLRTIEDLHALEERERKKTLGYFMNALRTRVNVQPAFDAALAIFLEDRNTFVHNMAQFSKWQPRTEEGCRECSSLLDLLDQRTQVVMNVFTGLLRAWETQNGTRITIPGYEAEFERIERQFIPLAGYFLTPKATPNA